MSELKTITLNGESQTTQAATIANLLVELNMPPIGVAVARNGAVVRRAEHGSTLIEPNDNIEIIRAVQGG
jgi:thiamine biosynthesis protein ThiS